MSGQFKTPHEGMVELRKGSRTSPFEDQRNKRARSRQDAKRAAVKDQRA